MKIIFCGPPHSGKTVMTNCLEKLLPSDGFYTFRIHRDGEGAWSNNADQKTVQAVREKADYDENFINAKCEELKQYSDVPILLVDIGGRLDDDKSIIFKSCDAFVVISNDNELKNKWIEFGEKNGCKCIACLDSVECGTEEIYGYEPYFTGRVANLVRGQEVKTQQVIKALADIIIDKSGYNVAYKQALGVIDFNKIAVELNIGNKRITSNNKTILFADYPLEKMQLVYQYLKENLRSNDTVSLYGARAVWLSAMTACLYFYKGKKVNVYDMRNKEYLEIHTLPKSNLSKTPEISYNIITEDEYIFLDFHLNVETYSYSEHYSHFILPDIPTDRKLLVSGGLPLWLLDSIIMSYESPERYVFQPGAMKPWICCYADDESKIGTLYELADFQKVKDYLGEKEKEKAIKEFDKKIKKKLPDSQSSREIERTYLIDKEDSVRENGTFKHFVHHIFIQTEDGIFRMSDKYQDKDGIHKYKLTVKKDKSAMDRMEINNELSKDKFDDYLSRYHDNVIGDVIMEVYNMNDGSTGMIRRFANGVVISTGEFEYQDEAQAESFGLPSWATKEVTDDPDYRGQAMAIANYKK